MILTRKRVVWCPEDVDKLASEWDEEKYYHHLDNSIIEEYPAVIYFEEDNSFDSMNYSCAVIYSITYLSDFED